MLQVKVRVHLSVWRLIGEDTEQMYSKHLSVQSNFRQKIWLSDWAKK